jgi:uncharacterized protein (UPF0548 family)
MRFVRPSDSRSIDRLVEALRCAEPTYADIGGTLVGKRPAGYRHLHRTAVVGHGSAAFHRAAKGLQSWQAHRQPGMRVLPGDAVIRPGATVVVTMGSPVIALAAPCRIIAVVDESSRWGFAYGTLPGHPEQGEEAFVTSLSDEGVVRFEITAFSRPGERIVRLAGPVGRGMQRAGTRGYLRALKRFVGAPD